MNTHAEKTQENKSQSITNELARKRGGGESTFQFVDSRPQVVAQKKLQEMANNSPQAKQASQLQAIANNHSSQQEQPIQIKENNTGLPDNLKTRIENLSGYSLDDVKVHRNSDKPAQLQAHAYAQGTDIHIAPGQEKHLPHEAWHVVQQKQGRVKPTMQMKGKVNVNDNAGLEQEADVIGVKSLEYTQIASGQNTFTSNTPYSVAQRKSKEEKNPKEQQDLMDLALEIKNNKAEITNVPEREIDNAIDILISAARTADGNSISEGLKILKSETEKSKSTQSENQSGSEPVQRSVWRFVGGIVGGILGSIIPIIGNYFGAKLGWQLGLDKDIVNAPKTWNNTPVVFSTLNNTNTFGNSVYTVLANAMTRHAPVNTIRAPMQVNTGNPAICYIPAGNTGPIMAERNDANITIAGVIGNDVYIQVNQVIVKATLTAAVGLTTFDAVNVNGVLTHIHVGHAIHSIP